MSPKAVVRPGCIQVCAVQRAGQRAADQTMQALGSWGLSRINTKMHRATASAPSPQGRKGLLVLGE